MCACVCPCVRAPACLSVCMCVCGITLMHFLRKVQEFHLHRGTHCFVIYNRKLNFNFLKDTADDWESRVFSFAIFFNW